MIQADITIWMIQGNPVGPSTTDAVWIYSLTYGGGIVSGDSISCEFTIRDGCTAVLTTQASTKVYKSLGSKCSEQFMEARVGSDALFAVIPDPVTCFSTARYSQKQVFRLASDSNLVIVDWITSGRHERGEKWDFELYKSTNHIISDDDQPFFLDTVLLEREGIASMVEHMWNYQVIAMVILWGPKLRHIQSQVQEDVRRMMSEQLHMPSGGLSRHAKSNSDPNSRRYFAKPTFIASCSVFGPKGSGVVVRIAAMTTESVYKFLQHELAGMEPLLGVTPYC
ncbi:urease accessory protein D isoform X2 [Tripterygium wilfordii]|uniref:urease accessory protein D isoform X2 n=1 Tax=Tripterygium wilfordii TaxID=458696 RepID=UPI0018F84519|nr:urease accessory protein D isoform X2 [Tripterygium wilfordii]